MPQRLLGQNFFIDKYIDSLRTGYKNNNSTLLENIVTVRHNLEEDLSKILRRIKNVQAILCVDQG